MRQRRLRRGECLPPRVTALCAAVTVGLLSTVEAAHAASASTAEASPRAPGTLSFNTSFLGKEAAQLDLARFERGASLPPGEYEVEVSLNQRALGRRSVTLVEQGDGFLTAPCLTASMLREMGVLLPDEPTPLSAVPPLAPPSKACLDLPAELPGAEVAFKASSLTLSISVPQASVKREPRGYVDPAKWDDGITAATFGYALNTFHREDRRRGDATQSSLRLNSGLSAGAWRVRHDSTYQWASGSGGRLTTIAAYARRDITPWRSQFSIGRSNTPGELFDSVAFDGVQLKRDDRMLPDSMTGYAPVVRGVARSHARVEIRQNGYLMYDTTVSPGPFEINDLYPSGVEGNLVVTVKEADGGIGTFVVPYAAVPRLLRPGSSRYSAVLGQLRAGREKAGETRFFEGTYQRGIDNTVTAFGGTQVTDNSRYASVVGGLALNTPAGAFSTDVTLSRARFAQGAGTQNGRSLRTSYSKSLPTAGTSIAVAAYRYSSEGYLSLRESAMVSDSLARASQYPSFNRRKNALQVSVSQNLPGNASLYVSGTSNDYWDRKSRETTYQVGYSGQWHSMSYSLSASRVRDAFGRSEHQAGISLSIPLGRTSRSAASMRVNYLTSKRDDSWRADLSGAAGANSQFNYNASVSDGTQAADRTLSASAGYRAPLASISASTSHNRNSRQHTFAASGGMVVHAGGVTFAPALSDTIGLVEAKGAAGARLSTGDARIGARGYAVSTSLRPYRENTITIDPGSTDEMVELETSTRKVAPRAGAVVKVTYANNRAALIEVRKPDGGALPFGADVLDSSGKAVGAVAQGSMVYLKGAVAGDRLEVRWGREGAREQCQFVMPAEDTKAKAGAVKPAACHAVEATATWYAPAIGLRRAA